MRLPEVQVVQNSAVMLVQVVVTTAIGLVLPPILLAKLGPMEYGIWAIMVLINIAVGFVDLGLGSAGIKYIAEEIGKGNKKEAFEYFGVLRALYVAVVGAGVLVAVTTGGGITRILLSSLPESSQYEPLFIVYMLASLLSTSALPYLISIRAANRYDKASIVEVVASGAGALLIVALVVLGAGLWAIVLGATASSVLRIFGAALAARPVYEEQQAGIPLKSLMRKLRKLLVLSTAEQTGKIYLLFTPILVRMTLERSLGVAFVGYYDLGKRIVNQINGIYTLAFVPLMPFVSAKATERDYSAIGALIRSCYKFLVALGVPIVIFFLLFSGPVMRAWLNQPDIQLAVFTCQCAIVFSFIEILTGPITTSAVAMGNVRIVIAKLGVSFALFSLVPLGAHLEGFLGVVITEGLAVSMGSCVAFWMYRNRFGYGLGKRLEIDAAAMICLSAIIWGVGFLLWKKTNSISLWDSLWSWASLAVVGMSLSLLGSYFAGVLTTREIGLVRSAIWKAELEGF